MRRNDFDERYIVGPPILITKFTMTILYKILTLLINIAGIFLAICLVLSLPMLVSSPLNMLSGFMLVCIILYAWFSNKFQKQVLQQQKVVNKSLRDWIRVNGIVSLIYSSVIIAGMLVFLQQPQTLVDQMKTMGVIVPVNSIQMMLSILLVFGIVLFVHIIWTFTLVKKNSSFFIP